jgi:protein TonB
MHRSVVLSLIFAAVASATAFGGKQTSAPEINQSLDRPVQLFPGDNARLQDSSQEITFEWKKVNGAARYGIQIDTYAWGWATDKGAPGVIAFAKEPKYKFAAHGVRLGAWRIWAIDKKFRPGPVSEWLVFASGPSNLIIPPPPSNGSLPAGFPPQDALPALPAPIQVSPADGAQMYGMPRLMTFKWSEVPGAARYGIEVDYYGKGWTRQQGRPAYVTSVREPSFTLQFWGAQPGAWRVWAIDKRSRPGEISKWALFNFGPANAAMPPPPDSGSANYESTLPAPASTPVAYLATPSQPPSGLQASPTTQKTLPNHPVFDSLSGEPCGWPPPPPEKRPPNIIPPTPVYAPDPEYSDAARHDKINADVTLVIDIDENGRVKHACVLDTPRPDLGIQALEKIRTWRFKPATQNGSPVPFTFTVKTSFRLYSTK